MSDPICPECGAVADRQGRRFDGPQGAMFRGLHRKREHGVEGTSSATGKRKRRRDRGPKAAPGKPKAPSLSSDLRRVFKVVGTLVAVPDPYCGAVLTDRSAAFCDALARLAAEDERIARWLRALGKAGPYGALAIAAGEIAIPISAHHGLVPPELAVLAGAKLPPSRARARVPLMEPEPESWGGPPERPEAPGPEPEPDSWDSPGALGVPSVVGPD